MDNNDVLERFAWVIRTYGVISSDFYDRLTIDKPSRWTLRQHFGNWEGSIQAAKKLLSDRGIRVEEKKRESLDIEETPVNEEVIKLTKQIEELTRHIQTDKLHLGGTSHKFGYVTDTHLCSLFSDLALLDTAYDIFEKEGIKTVFHSGDFCDGIRVYRGQEFELSVHGADGQVNLAVERYPKKKGITTYFITGNHDRSFWKLSGNEIGEKISSKRPDLVHLGYQEANIVVGDGECTAVVRLFHPEDGSMSYAISYKAQRYIAELPSGTKPDILLMGHYHKAEVLFYRGVVCIQGGALQAQTPFMRGKKISAAVGFWVIDMIVGPNRIVSLAPKFFPIRS